MKTSRLFSVLLFLSLISAVQAQPNTFTLNPLTSFGGRGDGSIQPGDSIGTSPVTGHNIQISAPLTAGVAYGVQAGDPSIATNGFNMRGLAYDAVSGNLIFVDTHEGQAGSAAMVTNAAIYVLDPNSGQIIGALNTNGMVGGSYTHVVPGVADDGVVYVCNQTTASTTTGFKIYRWATANTNDPSFNLPPVVAFTNTLSPSERFGLTMDVRGAGTNTQILVGSGNSVALSTNVLLFTTTDGTNFAVHVLSFPGIKSPVFNDGIAFGPTNTFFAKQVGSPLLYLAWDPVTFAGSIISSISASSVSGSDPLYNLAGIKVDNAHHLLAGLEEVGGATGVGPGKVWLYDLYDPTNKAPAVLSSRTYSANFAKATATMGYLAFAPGRLYATVVNNGFLASTVDSPALASPVFQLPPDYPSGQPKLTDLPATNRVAISQTAHFEVFAIADVTNYQWYSNEVAIAGANTYFIDVTNAQPANSGTVYKVIASNAVGSTESVHSTLTVVSSANFFHPVYITNFIAGATNYISSAASTTPPERTIAYNSLSNQLLIVRGASFAAMRIFVVDPDTGTYLYPLNTNGMITSVQLPLCGIGVADDGAVYACSVSSTAGTDQSFKVYRWADTGPNTVPQPIFGTNSSAANGNPIADQVGNQNYRIGDALAVHGAGINTEIIVDAQNNTKYVGILTPTDSTMTNWTQTGYLLQNTAGSYGFGAYGTGIGRSIQFGPLMPSPLGGNLPTFWQKRYNAAGAPLAVMSYALGSPIAALNEANLGLPLYTNGPIGINFTLNLAAAINFVATVGTSTTTPDTLSFYDLSDPLQAVLLSSQNLAGSFTGGGHLANGNAVGQVVFGFNPATQTNYLFVLDGNNGITTYGLSGGVIPPPKLLAQPKNLRVLQGTTGTLSVALDQTATIEWFKGTNPPVDTAVSGTVFNIANAQPSAAGDYFIIATNANGSVTSRVAHVSVSLANDNYTLSQTWSAGSTNASFPYVTTNAANTPSERSFAYNALSNQLIVVQNPVNADNYRVWVVDAATGTGLYTLNTNGIVNEGASEVSGANGLDLDAVAVADDGAVYACSLTPNASGGQLGDTNKMLHVFRWADSGSNTLPALVYEGDPSGQQVGINLRWGDTITARGAGTNTELLLNSHDGVYGALLRPTDSTMTVFSNYWFFDTAGPGTIGRSLQFGTTNTVYEKRHGGQLFYSRYSTNPPSSSLLSSIDSSATLGGAFVDTAHNLAAGVDFVGSTAAPLKPDAVALYDISDPTSPMFIKRYNFPVNEVANNNFICQTVIAGWKVYSLDANNGLVAFYINPPVNSMNLGITNAGANVNLSWGNSFAILQGTTNLSPTGWTDLTTAGQTNSIQSTASGIQFYRLILRR